MASIISYFGSAPAYIPIADQLNSPPSNLPSFDSWVGSKVFSENLVKFSKQDQLRFYLDQELALAYFLTFFGGRCHEAVNEYCATVASHASRFVSAERTNLNYGHYPRILEALENLIKYTRGSGKWVDAPIRSIMEFLNIESEGVKFLPLFFRYESMMTCLTSFLAWRNELPQEGYLVITGKCGVIVPVLCNSYRKDITSNIWDCVVRPDFAAISTAFDTTSTDIDKRLYHCSILAFLSHFDLSTTSPETIIGLISQFAFHTDVNRSGLSTTQLLAIAMRYGVTRELSFSGDSPCLESDLAHLRSSLFQMMSYFINWYVETWHIEKIDREILFRTFFVLADTKEQKTMATFLKQADASPSAEAWEAYKRILPGCESLQLISQNPTSVDTALDATVALKDETEGEGSNNNPETTEPKTGTDGTASTDDQNTDGDEGNDEPSEPEEDLDEQTEETDDDPTATPDEGEDESTENTDDGSSSEDETDETTTIHDESSQPALNLSDKRGIVLEWTKPDDETIDTALFREEVNTLISDILANPPKTMSTQNVATLLALKRYWLYTLRVESIVGILESCIRIPLTTKKLKSIGVINEL